MTSQRSVLHVQGGYYLITGLWPIAHLASFEAITGPKVDDWLVHMVGLLVAARRGTPTRETYALAIGSALAFSAIDTWYALEGRIAPVYLADAVVQMGMIALLLVSGRGAA